MYSPKHRHLSSTRLGILKNCIHATLYHKWTLRYRDL